MKCLKCGKEQDNHICADCTIEGRYRKEIDLSKCSFEELKAELNKRGYCVTRPLKVSQN